MPQDSNPFNCQTYSSPEVFVDRGGIVKKITQGLHKTSNDSPENLLILGERGIGKSSTIQFVQRRLVENEELKYRFLSVLIKIKKDTDRSFLIEVIEKGVRREIAKISFFEATKNLLHTIWGSISDIQIMGNKVGTKDEKMRCNDISELAKLITESSSKVKFSNEDMKGGILIIMDESDLASDILELGEFLKLLIETIRENRCNNTCFIVSGLFELEDKLFKSHESVLRLFSKLELKALSEDETTQLLRNGIKNANRIRHTNSHTRTITMQDSIMKEIFSKTKGSPYLVQKLASSMYDYAKEDKIKLSDLKNCPEYKNLLFQSF